MRRLKVLRGLSLSVALTVLLLAVGEGLARLGYEPPPPDEPWMAYSREAGWVRRPGFSGEVHSAVRTFDDQGLFPNDARGLARRPRRLILAVGDSRTFYRGLMAEWGWTSARPGPSSSNGGWPGPRW